VLAQQRLERLDPVVDRLQTVRLEVQTGRIVAQRERRLLQVGPRRLGPLQRLVQPGVEAGELPQRSDRLGEPRQRGRFPLVQRLVGAARLAEDRLGVAQELALGAQSRQVAWTVAREVAVLVGVGTAAGLTVSLLLNLALTRVAVPAVGISLDRSTAGTPGLLWIAAFMAFVGVAAAYVPARRAARMDPLAALRHD